MGGATDAKVDQTIETVFTDYLSRLSFIVAIQRNGWHAAKNITFVECSCLNRL